MKIRYRLAALVSAAALAGVAGLASAGTASASTGYEWCAGDPASCLYSQGSGHALQLAAVGRSTNFLSKHPETSGGREYVEYYQTGTNSCLTDSGAVGYLQTCSQGDSRQLWYYDGSNHELINLYATNLYGHNDCLAQNSVPNGVIIQACSIGGFAQDWSQA